MEKNHLSHRQNLIKLVITLSGIIILLCYGFYLYKSAKYKYHSEDISHAYVMIYLKSGEVKSFKISHYNATPQWIKSLYGYSFYIGLGLIYLCIGIMEKSNLKKWLIDYNLASFFILLVLTYASNWIYTNLIDTLNILYYITLTTLICAIYYLYNLLLSRH